MVFVESGKQNRFAEEQKDWRDWERWFYSASLVNLAESIAFHGDAFDRRN